MARIRFADALKIKQALNSAALDPTPDLACRMLTSKELHDLKAIVDYLTLRPTECGHVMWEWPMQQCPSCGIHDMHDREAGQR